MHYAWQSAAPMQFLRTRNVTNNVTMSDNVRYVRQPVNHQEWKERLLKFPPGAWPRAVCCLWTVQQHAPCPWHVHILGSRRLIRSFSMSISIYIYTHIIIHIYSQYIYTHNYTYMYIYSQYDKIDTCHCYTCLYPLYPANLLAAHIHNNAAFFKLATIPSQTSVHPAISPSCPNWRRSPSAKAQALPHLL